MKRALPFIIVLTVAAIAVGSGVFLYQKKRPGNAAPITAKTQPDAPGQIVHALGPENAPVILEEFGDFQCPPCGHLSEPINQLQQFSLFQNRLNLAFNLIYNTRALSAFIILFP